MVRTRVALLIWALMAVVRVARADGLWREEEPQKRRSAEAYRRKLRQVLLGDERAPLCQLMTVPSSAPERAVYMVRKMGTKDVTVASRTVKQSVWGQMMRELRTAGPGGSWRFDADSMRATLDRMRVEVTGREAALDADAAERVSELCRDILEDAQRVPPKDGGLDGVSYHATHWLPGGMLAGQTWSPAKNTIAAEFIAVEETLRAYAEASQAARPKLRTDLLERSKHVRERLRAERARKP